MSPFDYSRLMESTDDRRHMFGLVAKESEASDIREDKVSQLKSMIDAGTYSVEPGDFASKLLEKYNA